MTKQVVHTDKAPAASGPYSQAIVVNGMVFTAGQVAFLPGTKTLIAGGIREQTKQVLENVQAILAAAGASMDNVVKTTVFLTDINDFAAMNEVYATFFTSNPPARSTVQVAKLPGEGILVEIETIAAL
jgi:2-iminobutanoate/2-iminopropanoate deaminase